MRIAHITDPHLRRNIPGQPELPSQRSREAANVLTHALADARERGSDVIVITGDLVDVPGYLFHRGRDQAADGRAWNAVGEDYRWLRKVLDNCGLPWIVLPGAHDSPSMVREYLVNHPPIVDIEGVRFVSFWDQEIDNNLPRRVLQERRRFDSSLMDPSEFPQVHLQHFVIAPICGSDYPHTYPEAEELRTRIAASPQVALVLSGQYHPGSTPERHGKALFSATPAFCESPHPYRIFTIQPSLNGDTPRLSWEDVDLKPNLGPAKAVFVDRDGCINTLIAYHGGPEAMELLPGAAPGIRLLRSAGFRIVVVTNQSCVGKGYATPEIVAEVHDRMSALLADEGAEVDAVYSSYEAGRYAVTEEFRTDRTRKPHPQMILDAAETLQIDLTESFMLGDRWSDIEAGIAAGVTPILVRTGAGARTEKSLHHNRHGAVQCLIFDDLAQAASAIMESKK